MSVHHSVVFLRHKSVCVHVRILCAIFWFSGYWKKVGHFYLSAHQSVVSGDTHAGEIKAHNQRLLPKKLQKVVIYVIHYHHHLVGGIMTHIKIHLKMHNGEKSQMPEKSRRTINACCQKGYKKLWLIYM